MKDKSIFLQTFGSSPIMKVLDFLLENYLFDYTKLEVAEETGISRVTLDKFWDVFVKKGIVKETRRIGNGVLYKLNNKSPVVKKLKELDFVLASRYADKVTAKEQSNKARDYSIGRVAVAAHP